MPSNRRTHPVRTARSVAGLLMLAFALVACGQKPGVHIAGPGGGGVAGGLSTTGTTGGDLGTGTTTAGTTGTTGAGSFGSGTTGGGTTTGGAATTGGTTTGGGGAGTAGTSGGSAGGTSGGGGSQTPQGSDRTGAGPDKLVLGVHAPVTGAAPLPVTSFEKSRDLYWKYVLGEGQEILGRGEVEVIFRDDKYDPSSAIQVCREMSSEAFLLVGGGGTDQIQACGRYANQAGVPYFSAGVTEAGLSGLPYYFASSMTYKQQGPLIAAFVKQNFGDKKAAAIVTNTPNFDDAVQGWEQGVQQQGLDYYKTLRHPKGDSSWYNTYASELKSAGVEVLYINTSPVDYIRFAQQASGQGFTPQYVGVGITMGLNAVLGSGCDDVDNGIFLSPFPGLDWARKNVPQFFQAGQEHGAPTDDIALALWGIAKQQHAMFQRYGEVYGNDLTREDFRAVVEQQQNVETGVFPAVSYTPQDHFGANQAHVLQADCSSGEHRTLATFVSGF